MKCYAVSCVRFSLPSADGKARGHRNHLAPILTRTRLEYRFFSPFLMRQCRQLFQTLAARRLAATF